MGSTDSTGDKEKELDKFSYYSRAISELLTNDDDNDSADDGEKANVSFRSDALFENAIESGFSGLKGESLKMLLGQSVADLTPKVHEMQEQTVKMHNLKLLLRTRKQQQNHVDATCGIEHSQCPPKKRKISCSTSLQCDSAEETLLSDGASEEEDDELRFLLENDSSNVKAILKKYSDELSATLEHMGHRLEEVLDTVMSKFRPMTSPEKERLRRLIQDLPEENLVRVAEILRCHNGSETDPGDLISVNLKNADNVALWRLYYFTEAFQKGEYHPVGKNLTNDGVSSGSL